MTAERPFVLSLRAQRVLPIQAFGSTLGLAGLCLALQRAQTVLGIDSIWSQLVLWGSSALWVLLFAILLWQQLRGSSMWRQSWEQPAVAVSFSGMSLSVVLLAAAWYPTAPMYATIGWWCGVGAHVILCYCLVKSWLQYGAKVEDLSPAWFVPMVGNAVIAIHVQWFFYPELGWYFFAVAFGFWMVLNPLILHRLIFETQRSKWPPTVFILVAPPAILFLSYVSLTGGVDNFSKVLFYLSLFWIVFFTLFWRSLITLRPDLAMWAFTFPFSAFLMAYIEYLAGWNMLQHAVWLRIALCLLLLLSTIVVSVAVASLYLLRQRS